MLTLLYMHYAFLDRRTRKKKMNMLFFYQFFSHCFYLFFPCLLHMYHQIRDPNFESLYISLYRKICILQHKCGCVSLAPPLILWICILYPYPFFFWARQLILMNKICLFLVKRRKLFNMHKKVNCGTCTCSCFAAWWKGMMSNFSVLKTILSYWSGNA